MSWAYRLLFASSILACSVQAAHAQNTYTFPAQPLADALVSLSQQTGLVIDFGDVDVSGLTSAEVIAASTPRQALERILSSTSLEPVFVGPSVVRLQVRQPQRTREARPVRPSRTAQRVQVSYPETLLLQPVRVTATKRDQWSSDLPIGVTVIDDQDLAGRRIRDMSRLAAVTPGAVVTNLGTSRNKIFLRGISDGSFFDRTQSTVGIYLGETQIIFSDTNPDLRLVDIERVEVLRGPQSNLFGSGNLGGVLRVIPAQPDPMVIDYQVSSQISSTREGGVNIALDGVYNLPVIPDKFAVRASAYYDRDSGYIDNPVLGSSNINETMIAGGRLMSRWLINDRWTLESTVGHQTVQADDGQYINSSTGDFQKSSQFEEPYEDQFTFGSVGVQANWEAVDLASTTAITFRETSTRFDATSALPFFFEDPSLAGPADAPGLFDETIETFAITHESRLRYQPVPSIDLLIGVFASGRHTDAVSSLTFDRGDLLDFQEDQVRQDRLIEGALFADATFAVSPRWSIGLGGRLAIADFSTEIESVTVLPPDDLSLEQSETEFNWAPNFSLTYQWDTRHLAYARISRGYRVGGFNINTPPQSVLPDLSDGDTTDFLGQFISDNLWSFELGTKADIPYLPARIEAAMFAILWKDIQSDLILGTGRPAIVNAGDARIFGVEAAISAQPASWLNLSGNVTWTSAELTDANLAVGANGARLPTIPDVSAGLFLEAHRQITGNWTGALQLNATYLGPSNLLFQPDEFEQGDFATLDTALVARRGRVSVSIFADNLLNETANTFAFGNPFNLFDRTQATPLRPRTIGVRLRIGGD